MATKESPGFEDDVSLSPSSPKPVSNGTEDDEYEDSLDLDLKGIDSKVWLVRMPRFLMEKWKDIDGVGGKELGKVRIRNPPANEAGPQDSWKVKLVLNDTPENQGLPHEYDVNLTKRVVDNTYVFTEKDLPKFKKQRTNNYPAVSRGESSQANGAGGPHKDDPNYIPFVRTIPKKTAIVGTVCHECSVQPDRKDPNYRNIISQRKAVFETVQPKSRVTFLDNIPGVNTPSIGGSLRGNSSMFLRAQKRDARSGDGKATRIPKNELLDLLFKLFEEYDYWSMKGLRERTRQPESYLKEVLETMATLIKKGPYAMKYTLRPEFKQMKGMAGSLSEYMDKGEGSNDKQTTEEAEKKPDDDEEDEEMEVVEL
ncbi:transcription initiation factor IIF subunit beta [Trichomonascus vanleenenianus]|uniref:transcription factor IIF subunit TFG2 n=1 Tax=Trichomonascus vanleenenianus TaxID=2268995 RepID=UPI003ECA528C